MRSLIVLMRAYTYTRGLGTPTASQHNFDLGGGTQIFLVLLTQTGLEPRVFFYLQSDALPAEPPRHPTSTSTSRRSRQAAPFCPGGRGRGQGGGASGNAG